MSRLRVAWHGTPGCIASRRHGSRMPSWRVAGPRCSDRSRLVLLLVSDCAILAWSKPPAACSSRGDCQGSCGRAAFHLRPGGRYALCMDDGRIAVHLRRIRLRARCVCWHEQWCVAPSSTVAGPSADAAPSTHHCVHAQDCSPSCPS
eukprot:1888641-Prymnesium_polylepis.2